MKTLGLKLLLMLGLVAPVFAQSTDDRVPGDHFSLEGALELFKKSKSPEEFERFLNDPESRVNNLDLNGDGDVDYIRVINRTERNVHIFILQAVISDRESQDVAVIELEKLANGEAVLQITGDADVYGIETIIEPTEEVRINAGATTSRTVVNVWSWPCVQYVYDPYYVVWISPWDWHVRPRWWYSWRPVVYVDYYGWWQPYRPYYSYCHSHRVVYAPQVYRPYRCTSTIVSSRHQTQITHYRNTHRDRDIVRSSDRDRGNSSGRPVVNTSRDTDDRRSTYESPTRRNSAFEGSGRTSHSRRERESGTVNTTRQSSWQPSERSTERSSTWKPATREREVRSGGGQSSQRSDTWKPSRSTTPHQSPSVSPNRSRSSDGGSFKRSDSPKGRGRN